MRTRFPNETRKVTIEVTKSQLLGYIRHHWTSANHASFMALRVVDDVAAAAHRKEAAYHYGIHKKLSKIYKEFDT